jgi:hypothetical protein
VIESVERRERQPELYEWQVYALASRSHVSAWTVRRYASGYHVQGWAARAIARAAGEMGL